MAAVIRSVAVSVTELLGTVGVAANAITTAFNAINSGCEVVAATSEDWSVRTRERISHDRIMMSDQIRADAAIRLGQRVVDREKLLAKNPELAVAYNKALELFAERLDQPVKKD